MEGINKITERIAAETREEILAMQAETAEKCRVIKETNSNIAQEEYWKLIREGTKECEMQVSRLAGTAAMEAKKSILAMKQETVRRVFDKAVAALCDLPQDQYVDFLARQAGAAAATGLEELVFNERDKASCSKSVVKAANEILKRRGLLPKLTVSESTGSFKGGLVVKQGDIEVNCTAEKLVELSKSELTALVADVLFSD
ncbi:MAG: V-type ATP synthase subunit E family protein [Oscillospiraceae bacterium]|nr:V-type ATP synthase subunit E family protein [Oscillospiraceae bacterium]